MRELVTWTEEGIATTNNMIYISNRKRIKHFEVMNIMHQSIHNSIKIESKQELTYLPNEHDYHELTRHYEQQRSV